MAMISEQKAKKCNIKNFYLKFGWKATARSKSRMAVNGKELCVQISTVESCQEPNAECNFAPKTSRFMRNIFQQSAQETENCILLREGWRR